jgi:hypothetical protein
MCRILACNLLFMAAIPMLAQSKGSTIVLKTSWANQYRNELSIEATLTVLGLNKGQEADGDVHGGSRKNSVGLPMVAELLNGRGAQQDAGRSALDPGSNPQKNVYGAWRLWFEHPPAGGGTQCQTFSGNAPPICEHQALTGADSNPAHSFEIHPVFAVDGVSVARSSMILTSANTSVKKADKAFGDYAGKNKILHVVRSASALTLTSITLQDNYVEMNVRVTRSRVPTHRQSDGKVDGGYVVGDVMSTEDPEQALKKDVRLFYLRDSEPGDALDNAKPRDTFRLLGMPRINLDAVLTSSEGQIIGGHASAVRVRDGREGERRVAVHGICRCLCYKRGTAFNRKSAVTRVERWAFVP